jgi:ABC-type protease/lipase transport system fused ATPase/permease subunit
MKHVIRFVYLGFNKIVSAIHTFYAWLISRKLFILIFLAGLLTIALAFAGATFFAPMFPFQFIFCFLVLSFLLLGLLLSAIFLIALDRFAETLSVLLQQNVVIRNSQSALINTLNKHSSVIEREMNAMNHLIGALNKNEQAVLQLQKQLDDFKESAISPLKSS